MNTYKYIVSLLLLMTAIQLKAQNLPNESATSVPGSNTNPNTVPDAIYPGNVTIPGGLNYIRTFIPTEGIANAANIDENSAPTSVREGTIYKDGFNRDLLTVQKNAINNNGGIQHLKQPSNGSFSIISSTLLPYASGTAGFDVNGAAQSYSYNAIRYPNDGATGFSASMYQSDATTRQTVSYAPGKSQVGQSRGVANKMVTNVANQIRIWKLDAGGLPISNEYYGPNFLFGTTITDAGGGCSTTFKDKNGQLICKIQLQSSLLSGTTSSPINGITYYVYDDFGKLRYTIPPNATALFTTGTVNSAQLDNLCFQYRYEKGLMVEDRKPGEAGFTHYVYDRKQRLVMRQTPKERSAKDWEVTFYDAKGRVKGTSIYNHSDSRTNWQSLMNGNAIPTANTVPWYLMTTEGEAAYPPNVGLADNTMMSFSYYDDYRLADPNGNLWATFDSYRIFNSEIPGNLLNTVGKSNRTHDRVTGSLVRIMASPATDPGKTGDWRKSVVYYDDKGRGIYSVSQDLYQGNVIHQEFVANRYKFNNELWVTKKVFDNFKSQDGVTTHTEFTLNEYDGITGKLTAVKHKMDNSGWQILAMYTYDDLGRVKRNVIGNYGEVQDMAYNVRGQLEGINAVYAETGNKQNESRSFGESLKYDYGFTSPKYDGKVAGVIWRGSNINLKYAYGYTYDNAGRLTQADFRSKYGPYLNWVNTSFDYSVSNLQYDLNGNILSMNQKGPNPVAGNSSPTLVDKLVYKYEPQSNRLKNVSDAAGVNTSIENPVDFQDRSTGDIDYTYDENGNLQADKNKHITAISYTYFNKPAVVTFLNGNRIEYSYDAAGNKVQELILKPGAEKVTDYLGNFVYEQGKVQFASTASGRTTFNEGTLAPKETFFVKDHLGNVRSMIDVYTYPIVSYMASYELASANLENLYFENVNGVRSDKPGIITQSDGKAARLNGAESDRMIGTSLLVHVMAGDKVEMNVNNFYENYNPDHDIPVNPEDMLAGIISTLTGGNGSFQGSESHNVDLVGKFFTPDNFNQLQSAINANGSSSGKPKAYLNYILFDENMKAVKEMTGAYQATGDGTWSAIGTTTPILIPTNGYLAVYLSNASTFKGGLGSSGDVFFDQLSVRFTRGNLKEESHYYPFGLPMAGMGSADPGSKINKRKYQSNENNTELGLNWMDFHNRQYDAQLGRFLSVDPLASSTDYQSPYAGMDNNPVSVVDPLGLKGISNSSWVDYNPTKQDWDLMGSLTSYLDGISGVPGVDPIASANRTLMEGAGVREEQRETDRVMGQYFSILGEVYGTTDGGDPDPQSGGTKTKGEIWYYMYRVTGGSHAMTFRLSTKTVYDINSPRDENNKEIPLFEQKWVEDKGDYIKFNPLSFAYKYSQGNAKEWAMLAEREAGNKWALCPIYVPNPEAAQKWFDSHTGKGYYYNAGFNNCSIYVMDGLAAGGANIHHVWWPAPSSVNSTPTKYWQFPAKP